VRKLGAALLLSLGVVWVGLYARQHWGLPTMALAREQTARLQALIPQLENLKLRHYYWATGGRLLEYSRGLYADPQSAWSRALRSQPFDAVAERDYQRLVQLLKNGRVVVMGITHQQRCWEFQIDRGGFFRISYLYEPGYSLPADQGRERRYQAIDRNWYWLDEDWN